MDAETAMHVGEPKFLFPTSEKACPFSFLSLVHRTTSHGGDGVSVSPESNAKLLLSETVLRCSARKAGEDDRGERPLGEATRAWNLLSKGRKEGVGLFRRGREATEGKTLLPWEEITEPWDKNVREPATAVSLGSQSVPGPTENRPQSTAGSLRGSRPSGAAHRRTRLPRPSRHPEPRPGRGSGGQRIHCR